jgi:hypothetical protein
MIQHKNKSKKNRSRSRKRRRTRLRQKMLKPLRMMKPSPKKVRFLKKFHKKEQLLISKLLILSSKMELVKKLRIISYSQEKT